MGFIRIFNKIVKWTLIAVATLFSTVIIFVVFMFLEYVGIIEYNIKNKTDYLILWEWWWNKDSNGESVIDLAEVMPFDWDYFIIYYHFYEYKKIKEELAIETDMGELSESDSRRAMFIRNNKVVFYEDWYFHPSEPQKYTVMPYEGNYLLVKKEDAKFKAFKDKEGYLWLEKIE